MLPIGLGLLLLTGIGPLLAWRKSTIGNLRDQFTWPVAAALVTGAALALLGVPFWGAGLCFTLCALVTATIAQEFVRGAFVRKGATGTDLLTAMVGLVARSKRRYGGYIVHLGIALMFLGFAGQQFKVDEQVLLKPGQHATIRHQVIGHDYVVRHDALKVTDDGQKQMVTGHITILRNGNEIAKMYPARWFFRKHEQEPTTQVAIRRTPSDDLYIVLGGYNLGDQSASLQVVINPLVTWIWVGFGVLFLGAGIALLPERVFSFATARVPEGAATT